MNCPACGHAIDPALIIKASQSELAKRKRTGHTRPGARGLVRNPAGRKGKQKETK